MKLPVRKSAEGVVITTSSLRFAGATLALIGSLSVGAIGAVRYMDRAVDGPSTVEFARHLALEDSVHKEIMRHAEFQDSAIARIGRSAEQAARDNHSLACFISQNPLPLCKDQVNLRRAP